MADDALSSPARWHATVTYRTDAGPVDVPMLLGEIGELHDRIERGPHWDTIAKIKIRRMNHSKFDTSGRGGEENVMSGSLSWGIHSHQADRALPFEGRGRGSNPFGSANNFNGLRD